MFVAFPLRLVLTALAVCAVVFSVELVPAPSRGKSPERSVGGVPVCSCGLSFVLPLVLVFRVGTVVLMSVLVLWSLFWSVSPPSSCFSKAGVVEEIDSVVCCRRTAVGICVWTGELCCLRFALGYLRLAMLGFLSYPWFREQCAHCSTGNCISRIFVRVRSTCPEMPALVL
jgi:hypothetical protein